MILPDGTARKIINVFKYLNYWNVFTEGKHFCTGFEPHKLIIQDGPYYLTDANWIKGYFRKGGGFFVPPIPANIAKFKLGRSVILPDGSVRKIIRTTKSPYYLNVYTEGKPFSPGVKPHELVVK